MQQQSTTPATTPVPPKPATAVIQTYDPAAIATVAPTSGTSGTAPTSAGLGPIFRSYSQLIGHTVNPNEFLPTDNIADMPVVVLPPLRLNGWWDVSASAGTALNYDSNVTRASSGTIYHDFYEHTEASLNGRLGTAATPAQFQLTYNYNADLFARNTGFDTYTHNVSFQGRIGRGDVKWYPYFVSSFRSISTPAIGAGRESYDYYLEGVRGEEAIFPNLVHTYDFSHTSVEYGQRVGDDFQLWRLYQEMDLTPFMRVAPARFRVPSTTLTVFPWLEMKETAPENFAGVGELNGGAGARLGLNDQVHLEGRAGYGAVGSNDRSVRDGSYSGPRYDFSIDYQPLPELRLRVSYDRVLSFTPATIGRDVNVFDAVIEFPLTFGAHFTVVPALELYRADSTDYQVLGHAFFPEPSLQVTYQMNDHFAAFAKVQYRETDTDSPDFGFANDVKVLQTTAGITAAF